MSSPKRPSSLVSTEIEGAQPLSEKINSALPHPTDETSDPWLVSFDPNDPENPLVRFRALVLRHVQRSYCHSQNWSTWKRWYITFAGGILVLNASVSPTFLQGAFTYLISP
jgi:hypothetical protein